MTRHASVPGRFLEIAAGAPDRPAVVSDDVVVTYSHLARRSQALAMELRQRGVTADSIVAVCIDRSSGLVAAQLAAMLADGAFLPLDPAHPTERLEGIIRDAGPVVVLADPANASRFPRADLITLDGPTWERFESNGEPFEAREPAPGDLAYLIYTSGSTGTPKGVEVQHDSLANLVDWHQRAFRVTPDDRATQFAGPGFDALVWELWPYLTAGAAVHLVPDDVRADPVALRDWLVREGITISFAPTAIAEQLVRASWPPETRLRVLLTGADALHAYPRDGLPFAFVNAYGPTEATVVTSAGTVPTVADTRRPPTIGRAIDNVHLHVVGRDGAELPAGEPGELWIGGANVARGYRGRPELTEERFAEDPFGCGGRIYRSGDLVRVDAEGEVEFLGRVDDQVKIRGNRVEPGEVAAALSSMDVATSVFVDARPDAGGDLRLVAYLVTPDQPDVQAIRARLEERLPSYMIPAAFARLDALPLTPNGKVDKGLLPDPQPHPAAAPAATLSPVEAEVAEIVAELLDVPSVDRDDDFFQLGGHSLMGAQLVARLRDAFDIDLALRAVFDHPTVSGLATEVEEAILAKLSSGPDASGPAAVAQAAR